MEDVEGSDGGVDAVSGVRDVVWVARHRLQVHRSACEAICGFVKALMGRLNARALMLAPEY